MKYKLKQKHRTRVSCAFLLPLVALISLAYSAQAFAAPFVFNTYPGIGTLDNFSSVALGVSVDGKVVVGYSLMSVGYNRFHAFRWIGGTMSDLGTLGGSNSAATGVSADGKVVVGGVSITGDTDFHAFRWSDDKMTDLGTLGGIESAATGVSSNGNVVVGASSITGDTAIHAFRWTGDKMADLGTLGGTNSSATGVSAYGIIVVGESSITGDTATHAFRWTGDKMADLGTLGGTYSTATAVSTNGNVVVGESSITGDTAFHAFRWAGGEMTDLGTLNGINSAATAVSADGSVVVGYSSIPDKWSNNAFRWTKTTGMQTITDWLTNAGVSVTPGWKLTDATGVNGNGNVVVGYGTNPSGTMEAWLAKVGPESSGLLTDIPAYNASLAEEGSSAIQLGVSLPNLALFGAHHRSILDFDLARDANGLGAWTTGDVAGYKNTAKAELIEAGVSLDIKTARVGLGVGQDWARQDWSQEGRAKYDGQYVLAEVANRFGDGLEASVLGYYGLHNTKLKRNYMNGANVVTSNADPNSKSYAVRARIDWKDSTQFSSVSFSPYFAYTWVQTKLDGYTETGGGFPAAVDATEWDISDLRYGFATRTPLMSDLELRAAIEGVRRLESNTNGVNGQVNRPMGFQSAWPINHKKLGAWPYRLGLSDNSKYTGQHQREHRYRWWRPNLGCITRFQSNVLEVPIQKVRICAA